MHSFFGFPILIILLISACEPLRNQAERVSVECEVPRSSIIPAVYAKLSTSQGEQYKDSDIQSLNASFQTGIAAPQLNLPVTPGGCLILPAEAGIVQVHDSRNDESLTANIETQPLATSLQRFKLSPRPDFQVSLGCENEGIFASREFSQPLNVNYSGEPASFELELELYSVDDSHVKRLYRKPMGEPDFLLPKNISVKDISEGAYFLKVYGRHLADGIGGKPKLLNNERACRLTVLRGEVKIGGLDVGTDQIFPPYSTLPWEVQTPFETLNVCSEPKNAEHTESSTSTTCNPHGRCKDPLNFLATRVARTGDAGLFDFYFFSENRAGSRSPLYCQTLIVSENAPAIKVSWRHEELRREGSTLRKPYAVLEAEIEVNHKLLDQATLENNMMCKVDFEVKGRHLITDKSVVCTEGLCKGKPLSDFVPCSKNLGFTIVEALNQPAILLSRLRLSVRAHDGAGHIAEAETSIWINKSAWTVDDLTFTYKGTTFPIVSFLIDHTGDVVASFGSRAAVLRNNKWTDLDPENSNILSYYHLARTRDNGIQIARSTGNPAGLKIEVFNYDSAKMTRLFDIKDDNLISSCKKFLVGPGRAPYCLGFKVYEIFKLENSRWHHVAPAVAATDPLYESFFDWRILTDGRVAGISGSTLITLNGTDWKITEINLPDPDSSYELIEDFKGRFWFYSYKGPTKEGRSLHLLDGHRLISYPSTLQLTQTLSSIYHPFSSDGLKFFTVGLQRFNFTKDLWEILPYPKEQIEKLKDSQSQMTDSGKSFEYLSNLGVFEENEGLVYWPLRNLGYELSFFNQDIERFQDSLYFIDNTVSTNKTLRRVNVSFISAFDSRILETDDSFAIGSRLESQGGIDLFFFDGTQVKVRSGSIETKKSPKSLEGALQVIQLDEKKSCYSTFHGLWVYDQILDVSTRLSDRGTEESIDCLMSAQGDIWWINIKSKTVHKYSDENSLTIFQAQSKESVKFLRYFKGSSLIMLITDLRIVFFRTDGNLHSTIELNDVPGISNSVKFQNAAFLNKSLILFTLEGEGRQYSHFLYDISKDSFEHAWEYTKMVGNHALGQVKPNATATYILTPNKEAVVIEWKEGTWRKIGKLTDFLPVMKNKNVNPWWFAPDNQSRLWMVSRSPYALLRLDLDFAP